MGRNWIAVASADHVRLGREASFMQVHHGKAAALRRISPGDWVVYYSPTVAFGGKDKLRAFTAIGVVKDGDPYQADMGGGFHLFRRDVSWLGGHDAPIQPLLGVLEFTAGNSNWGYQLRFGLFPISDHDRQIIAEAMRAPA
ncbi:MAG TPA: EVE domain-containing protein [Stellaceae bacterium]|nr:EVE domain-containing protein [Stellaceae bacterium]